MLRTLRSRLSVSRAVREVRVMPRLVVETTIKASAERCFDLARDISVHCRTASHTRERAVAGVREGLIELGETVTFEGVHFGIRQRLTARISEFEFPCRFVDEMSEGAFESMRHIHEFLPVERGCVMRDTLIWTSPFGLIGRVADFLVLERYLRRFLLLRNAKLREIAENP